MRSVRTQIDITESSHLRKWFADNDIRDIRIGDYLDGCNKSKLCYLYNEKAESTDNLTYLILQFGSIDKAFNERYIIE